MGQELPMGDISSAEIVWGYGESGPLTLSPFYGAVTLSITETMNDVQEEAHGDASVDSVKGGTVIELTCPMARSSLDQLKVAIDGPISGNEITIKNKAGCNVRDRAKAIVIKRMCDGVPSNDKSGWIHLYHCFPYRAIELTYDRSTQRVFNVVFKVFVSLESGQVGEFGTIGVN